MGAYKYFYNILMKISLLETISMATLGLCLKNEWKPAYTGLVPEKFTVL